MGFFCWGQRTQRNMHSIPVTHKLICIYHMYHSITLYRFIELFFALRITELSVSFLRVFYSSRTHILCTHFQISITIWSCICMLWSLKYQWNLNIKKRVILQLELQIGFPFSFRISRVHIKISFIVKLDWNSQTSLSNG